VNIRESEAQAFAEFDVPVYAVNAQGSHLTNLDGLFRAKFENVVESEVTDGVMVQGKAFIKVKLPLNVYGNGQPIDLTRVRVYANTPSDPLVGCVPRTATTHHLYTGLCHPTAATTAQEAATSSR
jgi:hypothetical protein